MGIFSSKPAEGQVVVQVGPGMNVSKNGQNMTRRNNSTNGANTPANNAGYNGNTNRNKTVKNLASKLKKRKLK